MSLQDSVLLSLSHNRVTQL